MIKMVPKAPVAAIKAANALLQERLGVSYSDVLKDVHGGSVDPIKEVEAGDLTVDEFVASLQDQHGLVEGDGPRNLYRLALVGYAREEGWMTGRDGRIYSEVNERLVRIGVSEDDAEGTDFVAEIAPEFRLEVGDEGFEVPDGVPFDPVCRGIDIGDTLDSLDMHMSMAPDPGPGPSRLSI
jgi:hypothetical protein